MRKSLRSDIGPYCITPLWVAEAVSPKSLKLYVVLAARHADRVTGEAFPRRLTLRDETGFSESTIDRCIKELVASGALTVEQQKNERKEFFSNLYTVHTVQGGGVTREPTPGVSTDPHLASPVNPPGIKDEATSILTKIKEPKSSNMKDARTELDLEWIAKTGHLPVRR